LAIGQMSIVAPISGVLAAGLPVVFGLAVGERPGPTALTGVVLGIIAVVVITRVEGPADATDHEFASANPGRRGGRGIGEAFGAGSGFGLFFILLERSPGDSGLWPLVGTRISMLLAIGSVVALRRIPLDLAKGIGRRLVALGFINVLADLLFLLATRRGLLSLVAVITSMYPAATVILARSVLREQMVGQQMIGLAIAAVSVGLIAAG
jgi:drug/metabolite transporter (DMT)-like permease